MFIHLKKSCIALLIISVSLSSADSDFSAFDAESKLGAHGYKLDVSTRSALKQLWEASLAVQGHQVEPLYRAAYKYEVPQARNWERLSQKLITPGSTITVVAFGGSVTVGHHQYNENSSWPEELVTWMVKAFPHVTIHLINLGHGATVAMAAALCYYHDMPSSADLVLVEYSINGCGAGQCMDFSHPQVAGYEQLLRRVAVKAPQAAMLSVACFSFKITPKGEPGAYYKTGEDMHSVIAKRYNVPMVSVRDGLYDVMFNDTAMFEILGLTREQFMKDHIHPKLAGARVYGAGFVAWGVRHLVTKTLLQLTQHAVSTHQHHFRHHSYTYLNTLPSHHHHHMHRRLFGSFGLGARWQQSSLFGPRDNREGSAPHQLGLMAWLNSSQKRTSSSSSSSSGDGGSSMPTITTTSGSISEGDDSSSIGDDENVSDFWASSLEEAQAAAAAAPDLAAAASAAALPRAVSPVAAQQLDDDTYCVAGEEFKPTAVTIQGWDWVQEGRRDCSSPGCRKYGFKSYTPGSYIEFKFDTGRVLRDDRIQKGDKLALVMLFLKQQSYGIKNAFGVSDGMGIVRVTCETGCECEPMEVNGENTDLTAELDTAQTEISAHAHCIIGITLLKKTTTGGHKFRINGMAIAPYRD